MKPKPPPEQHREALLRSLQAGLTRHRPAAGAMLAAHPEQFLLISWTHSFYGSYRDIRLDLPGIERLLATPEPSPIEKQEIDSLRRRLLRVWHLFGDSLPWLSHWVARRDLRVTLEEVLRYLLDADGVARGIRALLKEPLVAAWQADRPVLLMGHSLGSVIAYDALWELSHEDRVDGSVDWLVTLGSPLATRFVRKRVKGAARTGKQRYPGNIRRWLNCSAKGDMTALHPRLAPFFGHIVDLGLTEQLIDRTDIYNHFYADFGLNPHKSYGYLAHAAVADVVGEWLETARSKPGG